MYTNSFTTSLLLLTAMVRSSSEREDDLHGGSVGGDNVWPANNQKHTAGKSLQKRDAEKRAMMNDGRTFFKSLAKVARAVHVHVRTRRTNFRGVTTSWSSSWTKLL